MSFFTENLFIYFQMKEKWDENGLELLSVKSTFESSLNVFAESGDKNICARTFHLLLWRPGCYHSTSKTHVRDSNSCASDLLDSLNWLNSCSF